MGFCISPGLNLVKWRDILVGKVKIFSNVDRRLEPYINLHNAKRCAKLCIFYCRQVNFLFLGNGHNIFAVNSVQPAFEVNGGYDCPSGDNIHLYRSRNGMEQWTINRTLLKGLPHQLSLLKRAWLWIIRRQPSNGCQFFLYIFWDFMHFLVSLPPKGVSPRYGVIRGVTPPKNKHDPLPLE